MKPRISLIDHTATRKAQFSNSNSVVLIGGREILHGLDWERRKMELDERSRGQCEFMIPVANGFERCRRRAEDPHHVVPRGSNGVDRDDRLVNLQALCRRHHQFVDNRRIKWAKSHASE